MFKRIILAATLAASPVAAQELVVATLNVESASDTDPRAVARLIRESDFADVWALQEVDSLESLTEYTVAAASTGRRASFRRIIPESGAITSQHRKNDYLGLVYNSSRLRQVETVELHGIRSVPGIGRLGEAEWDLRGALFLRLQDRDTGVEFYVGNVHLKCCGDDGTATRAYQATILKDWVAGQDTPVIPVGDFNIPVQPDEDGSTSDAFQTLSSEMTWIRPENPMATQCSDGFDSMLDHVFVRPGPNLDPIDVRILEEDDAFCEAESTGRPDHRPLVARFELR